RWLIFTSEERIGREPRRPLRVFGHFAGCGVGGDAPRHIKPHPAPLLLAAKLLSQRPADCVYIGDDLRDAQAARAAGMRFVAAGWGYHGEGGDPNAWNADAVVAHPRELLDLL